MTRPMTAVVSSNTQRSGIQSRNPVDNGGQSPHKRSGIASAKSRTREALKRIKSPSFRSRTVSNDRTITYSGRTVEKAASFAKKLEQEEKQESIEASVQNLKKKYGPGERDSLEREVLKRLGFDEYRPHETAPMKHSFLKKADRLSRSHSNQRKEKSEKKRTMNV